MKTILHVVDVAARPEKLFTALSTTDGLAGWWTTAVSGDAGAGGLIHFDFVNFNPDMQVTDLSAPSGVAWKCVGGVKEWADNTFTFRLEGGGGATDVEGRDRRLEGPQPTRLRFRQDYAAELSDDEYGSFNYNWGYYLESLKLYCETGQGKPFASQT